jgi:hypothetical protein
MFPMMLLASFNTKGLFEWINGEATLSLSLVFMLERNLLRLLELTIDCCGLAEGDSFRVGLEAFTGFSDSSHPFIKLFFLVYRFDRSSFDCPLGSF